MYKYRCVISNSADANAFYDTIAKIKWFYPHIEYAEQMVNYSLEKIITIPDEKGNPSAICIRFDFQNSITVVISEIYLYHIFYGKEVESLSKKISLPLHLLLSAAFMAMNIFVLRKISELFLIYLFLFPWFPLIYIVPLMVIYFICAWGIKKGMELPLLKIIFIELGGYLLIPFYAVLLIWSIIENSLKSISMIMLGVHYITWLLPAAAISAFIADRVTKK